MRAGRSTDEQHAPLMVSGISFLLSFGALALFWNFEVRRFYSPFSDEFSLFANSARQFHPVFSQWFLQGFSRYFVPYPEWSLASTNFARPVANAEYYLSSLVFRTHWNWYLLSTYLIQSMLVASVVYLSLRHLDLPVFTAAALGCICFVSPSFDLSVVYSTSFAFDLLASLFVIAGLNQLLSGRFFAAWILFAAALFTKETAFFALFAAAVVIFVTPTRDGTRRLLLPACFLVPYIVWGTLRELAFRGAQGVYALPADRPARYLVRILKDLLRWPIPFETVFRANYAQRSISLSVYLFVLMNMCFWIAGLFLAFRSVWSRMLVGRSRAVGDSRLSSQLQAVLVFCTGSLVILILIPNLQPRFGATFVPLFSLSLAAFLQLRTSMPLRALAYIFLFVPPVINATGRMLRFSQDVSTAHFQWAMAADYADKIARATAPSVYVLDDMSGGFSSPESIRRFTGYRGQLVRVNDLVSQDECDMQPRVVIRRSSPDSIQVNLGVDSPCAGHSFLSSGTRIPIGREKLTRTIGHTKVIYKGVPAATTHFLATAESLSVEIIDAPASSALLIADPKSKVYREQVP
jgi:hypothetical protein